MEIQEIVKNYKDIQHEVNGVKQGLTDVQKSLQRIETCLISDEEIGRIGLVQQVKDINYKVNEIDKIVKNIQKDAELATARRSVWATVFGAIGAGLIWLLDKIF
jgi:hypothetical protein